PGKPETRTESQYSRLLELYVPIRSEHEGKVKAVFEIYQDLEYLDADTSRQKRTLWISIFVGFSGIYFACFGIVWRASRRLTEQTLEIEKSEERNRDLARKLTSLINNVPGIVYRGHPDWALSLIGAEVEQVTGHASGEFTSGAVGWKEIIHPDDIEQVKETFRKAVREKSDILYVEYRIRHRDGGIRWIADRRQMIYDAEENFAHVDGLLLDITDRKRAEAELIQKHNILEAIIRAQSQAIEESEAKGVFEMLLQDILKMSESEYGFIGEVLETPEGRPYLKTYALTNISWNEETLAFYREQAPKGMEFRNLDTLFGAVLKTSRPVIANDPANDPRRGGL
ncbi:MAG: PAS domain-containing protein, partial [Thermodesulfobacteriota bacterium]